MELGDINDLPSEEAKEAFLEYMEGLCECNEKCPFSDLTESGKFGHCGYGELKCDVLFPDLKKDNKGWYGPCPCHVYGEEAIKAAQIMVDVYLGYK